MTIWKALRSRCETARAFDNRWMGESPGCFVSLLALIRDGGPGVSRTRDLRFRKLRKNRLQHQLEPTHDARFIALMDRFMPQWRRCREQPESVTCFARDFDFVPSRRDIRENGADSSKRMTRLKLASTA